MNSKKELIGPFIPIAFKINLAPYRIFRILRLEDEKLVVISTDEKKLQARVDVIPFKEENNQIVSYEFYPDSNKSCSFGEGNFIDDVKPYPDGLILMIKNADNAKALCHWKLEEQTPNTIDLDGVSCFAVNYKLSQAEPKIAVAYENSLKIIANANPQQVVYENKFESKIFSVALNYPNVFVVCQQSVKVINVDQDPSVNTKVLPIKCTPNSFVMISSPTKFLLYNGETVLQVLSADLSHNAQERFGQQPIHNYSLARFYLSTGITKNNKVTAFFYDFQQAMFVTVMEEIVGATSAGKYSFIATENDIFYLYNISTCLKLAIPGSKDSALKLLPQNPVNSANTEILPDKTTAAKVALVEFLYYYQQNKLGKSEYVYRSLALSLLLLKQYQTCIIDVLMVFGCFHFNEVCEDYTSTGQKDSDPESLKLLLNTLKDIKTFPDNTTEVNIKTAILEIISLLRDTTELNNFLKEDPNVDQVTIKQFASTLDDKTVKFILFAHYNEKEAAMETFNEIPNPSNDLLDLVVRLMKNNASDWQFIEEYGNSFIQKYTIRGIEILTDPKIDYSKALNYVQSNFKDIETLFLLGAVHHPHAVAKRQVVNQLSDKLCNSLIEISKPDFDKNEVSYLKCVINNKDSASVQDMKEEITAYLQDLVSSFPNELDTETLLKHIKEFSPSLQISIYLSANEFKEALDIIWESNNGDPDKAAISCRNCSNPPKAFELLIQKMKDQLEPSKFLPELTKLLSNNIDIIDVSYALGFLNNDASLDTTLSFVEQLYRSLLTSRRDAEFERANSEAEAFEAKYRRIRAQSGYVDLDSDQKCSKCDKPLGFSYVGRSPTGLLYHLNCLPDDGKPKNQ